MGILWRRIARPLGVWNKVIGTSLFMMPSCRSICSRRSSFESRSGTSSVRNSTSFPAFDQPLDLYFLCIIVLVPYLFFLCWDNTRRTTSSCICQHEVDVTSHKSDKRTRAFLVCFQTRAGMKGGTSSTLRYHSGSRTGTIDTGHSLGRLCNIFWGGVWFIHRSTTALP